MSMVVRENPDVCVHGWVQNSWLKNKSTVEGKYQYVCVCVCVCVCACAGRGGVRVVWWINPISKCDYSITVNKKSGGGRLASTPHHAPSLVINGQSFDFWISGTISSGVCGVTFSAVLTKLEMSGLGGVWCLRPTTEKVWQWSSIQLLIMRNKFQWVSRGYFFS